MTLIVLGSLPIVDILEREPRDLDLLATLSDFQETVFPEQPTILDKGHAFVKTDRQVWDCELIWPDSLSYELAELILQDPETTFDEYLNAWIPSLNILYMLKMSHRFKKNSPHFLKTMRDIQKMRAAGAVIQPEHEDFYKRRVKATYWYEHPNLNRSKEEFFNPEDDFYIYDHDSIHEAVALGDRPAYVKYAVPGQEVLSSKKRFFEEVDHETRIAGVYEETCVLALERSQIPNNFRKVPPQWSFKKALEKVCTSITSGWFREFAWEHYDEVLELYRRQGEIDYIVLFYENKDKLRPYEGAK
tara:strand:- start:848 stop:1753 length:906 start_codon:yes stop_codon:yes gene_type:complete